jgi:hypothetical protein
VDGKRPRKSGSFAGDIGELIKHFPDEARELGSKPMDARELQEKRDIHALLFEQAWRVDGAGKRPKR